MYCVVDLFGAGTETTSNTLRWALLFMIKYPEVQGVIEINQKCLFLLLALKNYHQHAFFYDYFLSEKVQSEIDQVIGQTRQPLMDDRTNLPYTYAVIHEIQRFANIITFTPPRMANKDTAVGGRLIPKVILFLRYVPYSIYVNESICNFCFVITGCDSAAIAEVNPTR